MENIKFLIKTRKTEFFKPYLIILLIHYIIVLLYYNVFTDIHRNLLVNTFLISFFWIIINLSLIISCSYISREIKPFTLDKNIITNLLKLSLFFSVLSLFLILMKPSKKESVENLTFLLSYRFLRIGLFLIIPILIYESKNLKEAIKKVKNRIKKDYKTLTKRIFFIDIVILIVGIPLILLIYFNKSSQEIIQYNNLSILIFTSTVLWTTKIYIEQLLILFTYHNVDFDKK